MREADLTQLCIRCSSVVSADARLWSVLRRKTAGRENDGGGERRLNGGIGKGPGEEATQAEVERTLAKQSTVGRAPQEERTMRALALKPEGRETAGGGFLPIALRTGATRLPEEIPHSPSDLMLRCLSSL